MGRTEWRACCLGLLAGAADAAGWIGTSIFPAHMTGNTALIGVALVGGHPGVALLRFGTIATFAIGLFGAALATTRFGRRGETLAVLGASGLAIVAALAFPHPWDVPPLAAALGAQNTALRRFGDKTLNTSFLTGDLQSGLAALARRLLGRPADGDALVMRVVTTLWLAYVAGAALGAVGTRLLRFPLLLVAVAMPFVLLLRDPAGEDVSGQGRDRSG